MNDPYEDNADSDKEERESLANGIMDFGGASAWASGDGRRTQPQGKVDCKVTKSN